MKLILTIPVLFLFNLVTPNVSPEQEQILIYQDMFNSRVTFFNNTSIYIHEKISIKNTRLAEEYYISHDSISTEIGSKGVLLNVSHLEQKSFKLEKVIIASDFKIKQIKDTSRIAVTEIWVGQPVFNKSMDKAIVMEEWSSGEWASEGRLFIYEKTNGKWEVKRTILKWM